MTQAATQSWSGRSDAIALPSLSAEWWREGFAVSGVLDGTRDLSMGGLAYKLVLDKPVMVEGVEASEVELPSLTGVKYAIQNLRENRYEMRLGDLWEVRCVRVKKSKKEGYSDSPEFQIDVMRRSAAAA